eukprot:SAG22_NODE_1347_length_4669_cov_12.718381_2_plen_675_part_00
MSSSAPAAAGVERRRLERLERRRSDSDSEDFDDFDDLDDLDDLSDSGDSEEERLYETERAAAAAAAAVVVWENAGVAVTGLAVDLHGPAANGGAAPLPLPLRLSLWQTAAVCGDGRVICPPSNGAKVLAFGRHDSACASQRLALLPLPAGLACSAAGRHKWCTAIAGGDGVVYALPYGADTVLAVRPGVGGGGGGDDDEAIVALPLPLPSAMAGSAARQQGSGWMAAATSGGGIVCSPPSGGGSALLVWPSGTHRSGLEGGANPAAAAAAVVELLPLPEGAGGGGDFRHEAGRGTLFWAAATGGDGRVFSPPCNAEAVLVIDPTAPTVVKLLPLPREVACRWTAAAVRPLQPDKPFKWQAATTGGDGCVYCPPSCAGCVLQIDPSRLPAVTALPLPPGVPDSGRGMWMAAAMGGDGKVYCPPSNAWSILVIDPSPGDGGGSGDALVTALPLPPGIDPKRQSKWLAACAGADGRVYCPPCDAGAMLIIAPGSEPGQPATVTAIPVPGLEGGFASLRNAVSNRPSWQAAVAMPDGSVFCPPAAAGAAALIVTPLGPRLLAAQQRLALARCFAAAASVEADSERGGARSSGGGGGPAARWLSDDLVEEVATLMRGGCLSTARYRGVVRRQPDDEAAMLPGRGCAADERRLPETASGSWTGPREDGMPAEYHGGLLNG